MPRTALCRFVLCTVKSRYPCSGLAPAAVFHSGEGLGGVAAGGSAAGVGERAVFAGTVVTDRVHTKDLTTGGDLDAVTDDRNLDLAAGVTHADFVVRAGEGHAT